MIAEALQHCAGIGPVRLARLHDVGVRSWWDVLDDPQRIPAGLRSGLVAESRRCIEALTVDDVRYFVNRFEGLDKWRILSHFSEQTSFFDIETMGLEYDAPITVIVCWHKGQLWSFVEHENLDDFLDLLDDVTLLASFNGGSFDVPRVCDAFHIPELPCPHLDLRWACYHQGIRGGLKDIAVSLGIVRPPDLQGVDGQHAIRLWSGWRESKNQAARAGLIRYCAADVLMLLVIADRLIGQNGCTPDWAWAQLPSALAMPPDSQPIVQPMHASSASGPKQLRARRMRRVG